MKVHIKLFVGIFSFFVTASQLGMLLEASPLISFSHPEVNSDASLSGIGHKLEKRNAAMASSAGKIFSNFGKAIATFFKKKKTRSIFAQALGLTAMAVAEGATTDGGQAAAILGAATYELGRKWREEHTRDGDVANNESKANQRKRPAEIAAENSTVNEDGEDEAVNEMEAKRIKTEKLDK